MIVGAGAAAGAGAGAGDPAAQRVPGVPASTTEA